MPVSERTYECVALEDPDRLWELHDGLLREKPGMSIAHNRVATRFARQLIQQLNFEVFDVRVNMGRVRCSGDTYYVPDVFVVPVRPGALESASPNALEIFTEPLPLVMEVWSPSTGDYDIDAKIPEYQRRGDAEIWRVHPFERTVTVWRRDAHGRYEETVYRTGVIRPMALPGVMIDLDALFA